MSTVIQERTPVVFEAVSDHEPIGECSQPVGNTTFVFELVFNPKIVGISIDQDAMDQALIDSRRAEPTESMESVFSRLGL